MATTTTKLMTFAEFEQLPNTSEGFPYELRHGELVKVAPPKIEHSRVQWQLRRLLESAAGDAGIARGAHDRPAREALPEPRRHLPVHR